jgi:hypothetical protein
MGKQVRAVEESGGLENTEDTEKAKEDEGPPGQGRFSPQNPA